TGGGEDGSGTPSPDSQSDSQMDFANSEAAAQNSKATKGTNGASKPSASTSQGSVSVAGAVAVNIELATSQAYIGDNRTITAGGVLTVTSATNVDGSATADGSAVTNATVFDPTTAVDTGQSTIDLGSGSTLKTSDAVTYYSGKDGSDITGLASGSTYYVYVVSGGKIKLYDTKANANAHGTTGLQTLSDTGTGTNHFFTGGGDTGTSVGVAIAVNYAKNTNLAYLGGSTFTAGGLDVEATTAEQAFAFDPTTAITNDTIDLGVTGLHTGDKVTYNANGGGVIGGLTDGKDYYVNVQADGTVKLYDSSED